MVVKSATKKKLLDLGFSDSIAHKLADDRKWDDLKDMSPDEIYEIIRISYPDWDPFNDEEKVALWRKLRRLEIKVVRDDMGEVDINRVYISVPYLSDEYYGVYNFRTKRLVSFNEGFRGLGSLFSPESIFDWHWLGGVPLPSDIKGNGGYFTVVNRMQNETLTKILRKLEDGYFFPVFYQSINRVDILSLWDVPEDDYDDDVFDGLGSLFG